MPQPDEQSSSDNEAPRALRTKRRLPDKILTAFHQACDQGDFEVAVGLLGILETILTRPPITRDAPRRRHEDGLVAAHMRLWDLKHSGAAGP